MAEVSFRISVIPTRVDELVRAFRAQIGPTRCQSGCLDCSVKRDEKHHGYIRFITTWKTKNHLRAFVNSEIMDRVLQLLELSTEIPDIVVRHEEETGGFASLEALREIHGHRDASPVEERPSRDGELRYSAGEDR